MQYSCNLPKLEEYIPLRKTRQLINEARNGHCWLANLTHGSQQFVTDLNRDQACQTIVKNLKEMSGPFQVMKVVAHYGRKE